MLDVLLSWIGRRILLETVYPTRRRRTPVQRIYRENGEKCKVATFPWLRHTPELQFGIGDLSIRVLN